MYTDFPRLPTGSHPISDVSCYNIKDSLSPWDPNASCSIYSQWDCLDESFMMQSKANAHNHQFLRYKQFNVR